MEKGYLPETIELEPRWRLGHDSKSSGKPDILIKDKNGDNLIIIECKTAGKEYRKEKKNTETDGGQLFSYWQQDNGIKWLALYASDWDGTKITYQSDIINCTDDANILKMSERDKDVKVFAHAKMTMSALRFGETLTIANGCPILSSVRTANPIK